MNCITMWRLYLRIGSGNSPRHSPDDLQKSCTNRAKTRPSNSGQTMAKQGQTTHQGLEGLTAAVRDVANASPAKGLPPVHLWNPPFCGDLDMRIASNGTWFYLGTPIGRPALVRLFSTILKREDGKHFLVTPVEKVGIRVDDAPFLAVEMLKETDRRGRVLRFRTNVDDWVPCDSAHRLRFEAAADGGLTPYLHVRADLWAKVTRALYYDLVDMGEERVVDGRPMFGIDSAGEFFSMADAEHAQPTVLLTQRAAHLNDHAGQISFPGGKIDATDASPLDAALREAEEEIGLGRQFIDPIGYLDLYATGFGFRILTTVARVKPGFKLHINHAEVDDTFEVPLAFLMDPANHQVHSKEFRGMERSYYAMPFAEHYIWGATAGILRVLYERIYLP